MSDFVRLCSAHHLPLSLGEANSSSDTYPDAPKRYFSSWLEQPLNQELALAYLNYLLALILLP